MSGLLINLIIQIISGAIGGNVAAGAAKNIDLGTLGNTIAGAGVGRVAKVDLAVVAVAGGGGAEDADAVGEEALA